MWRRRERSTNSPERQAFDVHDRQELATALAAVRSEVISLTVHMCWHGGAGHGYLGAAETFSVLLEPSALSGNHDVRGPMFDLRRERRGPRERFVTPPGPGVHMSANRSV
jgi:hypothetical protein